MICANCGRKAPQTAPCPCGLGGECPYAGGFGVCDRCYRMIVANANDRRRDVTHRPADGLVDSAHVVHRQFTAIPSSYPQAVDKKVSA